MTSFLGKLSAVTWIEPPPLCHGASSDPHESPFRKAGASRKMGSFIGEGLWMMVLTRMAVEVVLQWRRRKDRRPRSEAIEVEVLHEAILFLLQGFLWGLTSRLEDER
ncbi:hypothetical protein QQP08_014395 [Theobroma cacao]|nr:hypothetical protein QQP08_014395 [Theobroma cacao]